MLTTDRRRDAADRDFFFEPRLQFGIRKPAGWRFLQLASSDPEPRALVGMVQDIASPRQPRPTIQVSCRRGAPPAIWDLRQLLEAQLAFLSHELLDFERLSCSFDNIIGGRRAAHVQFRYTLQLPFAGGTWPTPVLAHTYLVPTPGLAFTIVMSSSPDALYYDEADFASALSSVRIGSPDSGVFGPILDRSRVVRLAGVRRSRPSAS